MQNFIFKNSIQKPAEILNDLTPEQVALLQLDRNTFIQKKLSFLEEKIKLFNFNIRQATIHDLYFMQNFISDNLRDAGVDPHVNEYELYRLVEFGHGTVVEEKSKIIACIFSISYNTPNSSAYAARLVVEKLHRGKKLGSLLKEYAYLLEMKTGAKVMQGLFDHVNTKVIDLHLNDHGGIFTDFHKNVIGWDPFFTSILPLTPTNLTHCVVNEEKINIYINSFTNEKEYMCVKYNDIDKIEYMYRETPFKIVATFFDKNSEKHFFALHSNLLGL